MRQPIEESPPDPVVARPLLDQSASDRLRDWIEWFGIARLVTSAIAVVVVCSGGWWLIHSPQGPPESALPVASPNSVAVDATLPPPSTRPGADTASGSAPAEPPEESGPVVVHIAGAVMVPGVFEFPAGSRVSDAIDRAGGASGEADPGMLNLAAPLIDGTRVYVPTVGEVVPPTVPPPLPVAGGGDAEVRVGPIDVNRASESELDSLPGVGPATAAAIVTERDRNGPFASVADLERVPGIGPAKLSALDGLVTT